LLRGACHRSRKRNLLARNGPVSTAPAVRPFVNELSSAAGIDSLDFRLTNTPDARDLDLLATIVRLSACESRKAPKKAHAKASALIGCGIAMTRYGANDARSALVIDVEIEPMTR
jgi:hypothetical protein